MIEGMHEFVDANVLLRYLTGSPPEFAERARTIIESGEEPLYVTPGGLSEVLFTLDRGRQAVPRPEIIEAIQRLLTNHRVRVWGEDRDRVLRALEFCRPNRTVSFGDGAVWATVREQDGMLYTFDADFPDEGIITRDALMTGDMHEFSMDDPDEE